MLALGMMVDDDVIPASRRLDRPIPAASDDDLPWWSITIRLVFVLLRVTAVAVIAVTTFLIVFTGLLSLPAFLIVGFLTVYFLNGFIRSRWKRFANRRARATSPALPAPVVDWADDLLGRDEPLDPRAQ